MVAHLIFYYRKMRYNIEWQKHMKRTKTLGKKQTTTQLGLGDNYGVYKWKYQDWETDDTMNEIYALINTNCDNGKY